jgi:hypothetical protein
LSEDINNRRDAALFYFDAFCALRRAASTHQHQDVDAERIDPDGHNE